MTVKYSADVIADIALCPVEAVKVRIQTQPRFARCLTNRLQKLVQTKGAFGIDTKCLVFIIMLKLIPFRATAEQYLMSCGNFRLYKGLLPLWGRQIPCELNSLTVIFSYCMCMPKVEEYIQCAKPIVVALNI